MTPCWFGTPSLWVRHGTIAHPLISDSLPNHGPPMFTEISTVQGKGKHDEQRTRMALFCSLCALTLTFAHLGLKRHVLEGE